MTAEPTATLLEMTSRPLLKASRPHGAGMLLRLVEPASDFYRFLLHSSGADADDARLRLADENLFELLQDPLIEVFVLYIGGSPGGYFELDRRAIGEVELVRVGLLAGFRGRGLTKYLLATAVGTAWDEEPDRVWVLVKGVDDSEALLLYQWAGFSPFATSTE